MKLDRKQRVLITLIIIAVAFLAWQLYDMFFASDDNTPTTATPATLQPLTPSSPTTTPPGIPTIASTPTPTPATPAPQPATPIAQLPPTPVASTTITTVTTPTPATPVTLTPPPPAAVPQQPQIRQMTLTEAITPTQVEYLRLVNRYQVVRMKRLVTDEEAAIAASQEKIAQLNQQIAKIGGQTSTSTSGIVSVPSVTGYQLMYIDNQGGRWTATLSKNGRFREVTPGMILSDSTRVIKIDDNGVVILQNGNYYLLNFYGTTRLPPQFSAPAAKPIPRPVVIKSKPRTVTRVRLPMRQPPLPVECVANSSSHCAPKINLAKNTVPTKPAATIALATVTPAHTAVAVIAPPAPVVAPITTTPAPAAPITTPTVHPFATAHAATLPPAPQLKPQPQLQPVPAPVPQNNPTPPPQPSPLLYPRPPSILPLKSKHDKLALTTEQENKVTQIEIATPTKLAVFDIDSYSADEKHLLASPPNSYTLQLIGNDKLSDLTDFIKTYKLDNKAYTFHTFYLNKDWFVLIYGIYKTQEDALNAIKELPPAAQHLKPWVRTLASVQEAIKLAPANR